MWWYSARSSGGRREPRGPERMELRAPQRLVGVDVADARDEALVDEERLEPRPAAADPGPERLEREAVVERLRADPVERVVVREVEPDPPELAHVAEPQLGAVVQRERQPLVGVDRQRRRHDEQLPGHLEVDGEERAAGEVDDDLLAAPADGLDPPAGHAADERLRVLVAQRPGPRDARAGDLRAGPAALGQQPAPEVARDGLDLGQLRHRSDDRTRPAAVRCATTRVGTGHPAPWVPP